MYFTYGLFIYQNNITCEKIIQIDDTASIELEENICAGLIYLPCISDV